MRRDRRPILALILMALTLAGCAAQASRDLLVEPAIEARAGAVSGEHTIFVATTRTKAAKASEVFDGGRSPSTSYASVDVTVPATHQIGAIERRKQRQKPDPAKYFVARSVSAYGSEDAFGKALRADIASHGGRAMVFVHGYNTAFDSAIYRMTQIVHDSGYAGTPVLFSWASGGKTVDYVYDSNSASAARDSLEETLRLLSRSGARRIDIIAHSMGNWVTMEALRQLAIAGDRDLGNKLGDVVLASPDIDVDVFKSQMARYGRPDKPFILFISNDDRALRVSSFIAGNKPRVGDYGQADDLAKLGVIAVDLSNVKSANRLNHAKFADNPLLITILGDRLRQDDDLDANERQVTDRINGLAKGLGSTLGSAAEIIVTTPLEVLNIVVGGN